MDRPVTIETADGVTLKGAVFVPDGATKAAVLISSATGFPHWYYAYLAEYLAKQGAVVLIYDYRGIASSATPALMQNADLPDWGRDLEAAASWLSRTYPDLPLFHIAHSVGGHIAGLTPSALKFERQLFVASGAGNWWLHKKRLWPQEFYFWWVLGSFSLEFWGQIKTIGGWKGTALPGPVLRTWRRWSHTRGYHKELIETGVYSQITLPIRSVIFPDDLIATRAAAKVILASYPNAQSEIVQQNPSDFGLRRIGHEGAFRPGREMLWQDWWDWLSEAL